jgi:DHA2 family methylenomycin A resistance protein-like MFS transporter
VVGLAALLATVHLKSALLVAVCVIPIGAGGSLAMPAVTGVVLDGVTPNQAGTASAVFNTFRQVGGAVAIAAFGSLIAGSKTFLPGVQASLAIAAILLLITALISLQVRTRQATS